MNVDGLRELDEMAAKLEATARKLPQGLRHDELRRRRRCQNPSG
jgi:hypothetical protein